MRSGRQNMSAFLKMYSHCMAMDSICHFRFCSIFVVLFQPRDVENRRIFFIFKHLSDVQQNRKNNIPTVKGAERDFFHQPWSVRERLSRRYPFEWRHSHWWNRLWSRHFKSQGSDRCNRCSRRRCKQSEFRRIGYNQRKDCCCWITLPEKHF